METLKLLLATDGSDEAAAACKFLQLLPLSEGSAIRVVSVVAAPLTSEVDLYWRTTQQVLKYEREQADAALRCATKLLKREGVWLTTVMREGAPAKEILLSAEEFDADLVVIGSKGLSGLEGFLLGSVARMVAKRCERPVLVARAPQTGIREVIVATDGSAHATHAIQFAARLPLPEGAQQTVVHVVRPYKPLPQPMFIDREEHQRTVAEVRRKQQEIGTSLVVAAATSLATLEKAAPPDYTAAGNLNWGPEGALFWRPSGRGAPRTELRVGDPATEILELARERKADLIVAGARGVSFIEGLRMGSVADRLLRHARCSVLIVH